MAERKYIRKEGRAWFDTGPMGLIGKFIEYYHDGETHLGTVKHADDDSFFVNGIWVQNGNIEEVING